METRKFEVLEKGKPTTVEPSTKLPEIVAVDSTSPRNRDRKKKSLLSATLPTTSTKLPTSSAQVSFEERPSTTTRVNYVIRRSIDDEHPKSDMVCPKSSEESPPESLPQLISNDKRRSTSYRRFARSSDFEKVKASPLATRFVYNWKPMERQPTRVVQAKVKVYKPPKRIEMTGRPPSPYRLCVDYETKDPHAHNSERTMAMKRLQYLREHTEWSIYPYAGVEEKEEYNKRIRETLKGQMSQKDQLLKKIFEDKSLEYKFFVEQDKNMLEADKKKKAEKLDYLKTYRDENKQMMEDKWMHKYLLKRNEWQEENNLLKLDPVNWSKTLR